jgi:hypothetical protein
MPRRFICDTNVFYDQAVGAIDLRGSLGNGDTVWVPPLVAYELCAKLEANNFSVRQAAAKAILDLNASWLPVTDILVCELVGTAAPREDLHYRDAVAALASATDLGQALNGVPDHSAQLCRKISPATANAFLDVLKCEWMSTIDGALQGYMPKYATYLALPPAARRRVPKLPEGEWAALAAHVASEAWQLEALRIMVARAAKVQASAGVSAIDPATHVVPTSSAASFRFFGKVFGRYKFELLTKGRRPEPNDSADAEYLLYVNGPDDVFVTSEKLWIRCANEAGVASSCFKPPSV